MIDADFERIFLEHKDAVYRFAWRTTRSYAAAEDITQEVFLSLMRRPERFDETKGPLRPFLLGVARHLALRLWRGDRKLQELEEEQFRAEPLDMERGEMSELVKKAVWSLPALQREVVILAEYEELSLEEISQVVQSEVGTVKSRLHRARENLRRMLAPVKSSHSTR